ncbi:MAG: ABC transporter ATP-binding protein, partial [Prochlorococcaceae cyanobacterium]
MSALRFDLIRRHLRPHRRTVLLGAAALLVVNLLGVALPLLVRRTIDDLQDGFALPEVLRQAGVIVVLASVMATVRLVSRMLV